MFAKTLQKDHREIDELYRAALAAVSSGGRAAALIRVDVFWARLAMHIRAEHHHLFPALVGADETVGRLKSDHDLFMTRLASVMKLLRASESDAEPDIDRALTILEELGPLLAEHNRVEENTVYSHAADRLTDEERGELTRSIEKEISELPPRFSDREAATSTK